MKKIYGGSSRLFAKQQKISPLAQSQASNLANDQSKDSSLKSDQSRECKASTIDFLSTTSDVSSSEISSGDDYDGPYLSSSSSSEEEDLDPGKNPKVEAPSEPVYAEVKKSKASNPFEEINEEQKVGENLIGREKVVDRPPGSPSIFEGLKPVARSRTVEKPVATERTQAKSARFSAKPPQKLVAQLCKV